MTNRRAILERVFQRECRSLGQYLAESWPWTHRGDRAAQELVHSIRTDERRWAEQLGKMITVGGGMAIAGNYSADYTDTNYLALDFMLKQLADYLEGNVHALRHDLSATKDDPELHALLEQMIERKHGQIEALRVLAATLAAEKARSY